MKKTILLVEDSMTDAFVINDILYGHYRVVHIHHANNILKDVRFIRPDLVLMDIVMPGVSGFGATRILKQHHETRHIPLIVCSSKSMETDRIWARRNGADDYIVKPPSKLALLSKVGAVLRNKEVGKGYNPAHIVGGQQRRDQP